MISTLQGIVSEKTLDTIVLNVGGVGYGVNVTGEDHANLGIDESSTLYIYEHIRENSYELFGFVSKSTKQLFEQLLSVNGVGPKMALGVLSLGNVELVANAIANKDAQYVQQATGVGKRVAERIVVDLKDKVSATGNYSSVSNISQQDEAVQGLVALGYTLADAQTALSEVASELPVEDRIKLALRASK